jgi:hypothetical protein
MHGADIPLLNGEDDEIIANLLSVMPEKKGEKSGHWILKKE